MHDSSQSKLSHLNSSSSEYTHTHYGSVSMAKTENEHNIVMWFKFQIHVICLHAMFPARIKNWDWDYQYRVVRMLNLPISARVKISYKYKNCISSKY